MGTTVDGTSILDRFDDLSVWKQGDQRAPHKPLLVLYALGRWQQSIWVRTTSTPAPASARTAVSSTRPWLTGNQVAVAGGAAMASSSGRVTSRAPRCRISLDLD